MAEIRFILNQKFQVPFKISSYAGPSVGPYGSELIWYFGT